MPGIPDGTTAQEARRRADQHAQRSIELRSQAHGLIARADTHSRWNERYRKYADLMENTTDGDEEPEVEA